MVSIHYLRTINSIALLYFLREPNTQRVRYTEEYCESMWIFLCVTYDLQSTLECQSKACILQDLRKKIPWIKPYSYNLWLASRNSLQNIEAKVPLLPSDIIVIVYSLNSFVNRALVTFNYSLLYYYGYLKSFPYSKLS